tara:strand:+ start:1231 stop:1413 length:183 start_codon:yes stop_codon:yes gene_type:complete
MPTLTEQWIEVDDEHVKHVQEVTYTKAELATRLSVFIRPEPRVITKRGIESDISALEGNQ